ncbi:type II toxin-antitoxin system RelE/ParE family toxin [Methylobacterium sp. A54F]
MPWRVEILNETVLAELEAWPPRVRAALDKIVERIERLGLERLQPPHVKHLQGKLWEMRPSASGDDGRALYVAVTGRRVVIVAAFMKKSRKAPRRWIDLALDRAKDIPE